jgi:hypothetical protein
MERLVANCYTFQHSMVIWYLINMCEEDPQPPIVHTSMSAIPNMILANQNNKQLDDAKERSEVLADN